MSYSTDSVRNIAIAGHGATGKTTIFEHLLAEGGTIDRAEPISSGKTVSDCSDEEIERKISIHLAAGYIERDGVVVSLLDTPGASDFVGEVDTAFRVCETALLMVGVKEGVQIETLKLWRRLEAQSKPRAVFINKLDAESAEFETALSDLQGKFDSNFVPVVIPIAGAEGYRGVIDLVKKVAYLIPAGGSAEVASDIPADMNDIVEEYRAALIEAAAEGSDELMEKYFEEETLTDEEILAGLKQAFADNKVVPVLCGSAELSNGVKPALDFAVSVAPSPLGSFETIVDDDEKTQQEISEDGSPSCFVFKTAIDQFSGKLSYSKIVTGKVTSDMELYNVREQARQRIGKLYRVIGKKLVDTDTLHAGDIGIFAKLDTAHTSDTMCAQDALVRYAPISVPQPVHSVAVYAASKNDEDKMNQFLQRASEEDTTFTIRFNPETKQTVISGMGELHINMILAKIKEKQNVEVETKVPRVPYRETITKSSDAEYTHKKQTGGHGQYGRVVLQIGPLVRGEKYSFTNAIKGGAVSRGYIPGVEKGILEGMETGILAGYPVVDVAATIIDGKEHSVDSSEMAFKLAAKGAFMAAMEKAAPTLLEPNAILKVYTNDEHVGDILSDLSSRRGRVLGQESLGGGITEIDAQVPQSELLRYSIDLRSITSGTASFEMAFDHYNPISGKLAADVIAASKGEAESE